MTTTPESVKQMLSSQDLGDRLRAVNLVRQLEPTIGYELIQTAINDSNSRVRYSAVSQLDTLGNQNLDLTLKVLRDCLFNDPEADVQAAAADCLGALKIEEAFQDLQEVYHSTKEWIVQLSIIAALGELGDLRAFDLLKEALASNNELVMTAAIGSLGELGNPQAVPILAPFVTHPDWQLRYRLVQALKNLDSADAKSVLETLANDEVEAVATEAKKSLSES